jgi:hypothetical protein
VSDARSVTDRLDIIATCQRVHWTYDHETWADLDELFTDPVAMPTVAQAAAIDFDPNDYLERYLVSRAQLRHGMSSFKQGLLTQHLVAGHHVDLDGDRAVCRAHSINIHFPADDVRDRTLLGHGNEYRFDLVRTAAGWRIRGWVPWVRWSYGADRAHDVAAKQQAWLDSAP